MERFYNWGIASETEENVFPFSHQQSKVLELLSTLSSSDLIQTLNKTFPGKLTQIKEFPIEKSNQQPYKLQKALIDQKIVPCINVRPYVFHDLMVR